ncbi:protein of unknown function [Mesotoga infera]|uniref:Uncharacterized protein n=1 Tax=Mesotoga infera TaxID=1236046 RepID=A0A7Z7LHV2_9BACT|nr:protein of unknown function [Mesotoga infera]
MDQRRGDAARTDKTSQFHRHCDIHSIHPLPCQKEVHPDGRSHPLVRPVTWKRWSGCLLLLYVVNFHEIAARAGMYTPFEIFVGIVGIMILLEICRRAVRLPIVIVVLGFIIYTFYSGFSYRRIVVHLFYGRCDRHSSGRLFDFYRSLHSLRSLS